ncbi:MAG: hypothetical protein WC586_03260 [Methanoregula sp.]
MNTQSISPVLILVFIILSVFIGGCTSQTPPVSPVIQTPLPQTGTELSKIEPSQMVLQPSELPSTVTLVEKSERNISEMRSWAVDHGWKKGYWAMFRKNDPNSPPGTIFEQIISVYPSENITLIIPNTIEAYKNGMIRENNANMTLAVLPSPGIGDSSNALVFSDKSDNTRMYLISFVKKDVYQDFRTNGTAADYETARQMARAAAAKIP